MKLSQQVQNLSGGSEAAITAPTIILSYFVSCIMSQLQLRYSMHSSLYAPKEHFSINIQPLTPRRKQASKIGVTRSSLLRHLCRLQRRTCLPLCSCPAVSSQSRYQAVSFISSDLVPPRMHAWIPGAIMQTCLFMHILQTDRVGAIHFRIPCATSASLSHAASWPLVRI